MLQKKTVSLLFFLLIGLASTPCPSQAQDDKENSEFKLAVNLFKDGMFDLAVDQFKNFVNAYPATSQGIEARFYLGLTEMKLKHYDEARVTFQNFALTYTEHPKAPEAWQKVAENYLAMNNLQEAASAYERIRVFHPKSPLVAEALLRAGRLYRRTSDRESAKKALRGLIQDYPTSSSVSAARLEMGEMYAEEGQMELAEGEAKRVSESDGPAPVKASALCTLGKLQASEGLFDDAERTLRQVRSLYAGTTAALGATFELGKLQAGAGNFSPAAESFSAVAADTSAPDTLQAMALMEMAKAFSARHDDANAQSSFERLIENFPKSPLSALAELEAGRSALLRSHGAAAIAHSKKILSGPQSPLRAEALHLAARASTQLKQYTEAARYYGTIADAYPEDPGTPEATLELAVLYREKLQDYRAAITAYQQFLQRYPRSPSVIGALKGIGECEEALGEPASAQATYEKIRALYPANDDADTLRLRIAYLRDHSIKRRDEGIDRLARLIGEVLSERSKAKLAYELAEIYFNDLKSYAQAATQYTIAIEGGLDEREFTNAYYTRARAYHLQSDIDPAAADQAVLYYEAFLKQFPSDPRSEDAAYSSYELRAKNKSRQEGTTLADDFLAKHPASPYRDRVLFDIGSSASDEGRYRDALTSLEAVIRDFPASQLRADALFKEGLSYAKLGIADSANLAWQKASSADPPGPATVRALRSLAGAYRTNKNFPEAIALWRRISSEFFYTSAAQEALAMLPGAYIANGQYDEAIALYDSTLRTGDRSALFGLATAFDRKGNKHEAAAYYTEYLVRNRNGADSKAAFYALGVIARSLGKPGAASSYFKAAAVLPGGGSDATADIAELLFQTEQYGEASRQYALLAAASGDANERMKFQSRAIVAMIRADRLPEAEKMTAEFSKAYGEKNEYRPEFLFETGSFYFRREDYQRAKKTFETLADDFEQTRFGPWGFYYLGKIAEVKNSNDEAIKQYDRVIGKFPTSDVIPRVWLSVGNMYFNAERFEDAIRYYQNILTAGAEKAKDILPYAMNNLIEAYESTKLYDAALKTTRDFIERFPYDESIIDKKIKIGALFTRLGYYDQAVLHFQNLLGEAGSALEAEIRYNIGEAYYYKNDYQQAILEFLKVPYLVYKQGKVNWTATSFYMAGQAYEKMSKFDEAIGMYQQIVERPGIDATFKAAARKEIERVRSIIRKGSK